LTTTARSFVEKGDDLVTKAPKMRKLQPKQPELERIEILLVEDKESDAQRTLDALRNGKVANHVVWVDDGEKALDLLHREGSFARARRPDLILLDWYLPRVTGEEVLNHIKTDPDLKRIPVVIMTSSDLERDILRAYNLHANCFVNKPVDVREFIDVVRSIEDFWLSVVRLPAA
jgi:CheY-like chemotaxis protein